MKITIKGSNFTGSYFSLNKKEIIEISYLEFLHAAATYGYSTNKHKFIEMVKRVSTILLALKKQDNNFYAKSNSYLEDDSTEKRYSSYVLGMTSAKVIAKEKLDFEYLIFFEHLIKNPSVYMTPNNLKTKPDFISFKDNQWLVLEAKGTSNIFSSSRMKKGKEQAKSIASINGTRPLSVVTQSFFSNTVKINYEDPKSEEGASVKYTGEDIDEIHYKSIDKVFENANSYYTKYNDEVIILKGMYFSEYKIFVGTIPHLSTKIRNNKQLLKKLKNRKDELLDFYVGSDGVFVLDLSKSKNNYKNKVQNEMHEFHLHKLLHAMKIMYI